MASRDPSVREPHPGPFGRRRLKKLVLFGLPLLLLLGAGAFAGLAFVGLVDAPYLPFAKKRKPVKVPKDDGRGGPFASLLAQAESLGRQAADVPPPPKAAVAARKKPDTEPGEAKLAGLWGELPPDRLVAVIEGWPPAQLGRILTQMDDEAVTNLLAAMPASKAALLSRAVADATDEKAAKVRPDGEK